jgi:hypothetical protein
VPALARHAHKRLQKVMIMPEVVPPLVALVTAGSILLLAALGVVGAAGYLLGCRIWPYTTCPRCTGDGTSRAPMRKAFRDCPRCHGTGRRTRIGRRLLDRQDNH